MTESKKKETRRSFLNKLGAGTIVVAFAGNLFAWVRSFVPNVLYEPLQKFKVGMAADLPDGVKFFSEQKEFIAKNHKKMHAHTAVCTHLGCTVKHVQLAKPKTVKIDGKDVEINHEYHCPCHGSKFYEDGTNYEGPAPTPLPWHKIDIAPDDQQLVIDTSIEVKKGTEFNIS